MLNISFKPEYIFTLAGFSVSNSLFTSLIVTVLLILFSLYFYARRDSDDFLVTSIKSLLYELIKLIDGVTEDRSLTRQVLPLVATFFIFIVTANLIALIPGFLGSFYVKIGSARLPLLRSPNSDLNTTVALALVSVFAIQMFSLKFLGVFGYLGKFINFRSPIKFILGFFEIISEAAKILSFSFRLFGNIFAGEVLLLVIAFLIPFIIPLPFMILEIFVGIIQAFIFAMLTLTFIKTSIVRHISTTNTLQTNNKG